MLFALIFILYASINTNNFKQLTPINAPQELVKISNRLKHSLTTHKRSSAV
jgi:hypothetical protein